MVSSLEAAFASSTAARSVHAAPPVSHAVLVVASDVSSVLCTAKLAACAAVARKSAATSAIAQVSSARASPERCIECLPIGARRFESQPGAARISEPLSVLHQPGDPRQLLQSVHRPG